MSVDHVAPQLAPKPPSPDPVNRPEPAARAPRATSSSAHTLDVTRAAAVMLRRAGERATSVPGVADAARIGKLAIAGSEVAALVREIVQVASLDRIHWHDLEHELAYALRRMLGLRNELVDDLAPIGHEVEEARSALKDAVPLDVWQRATGAKHAAPPARLGDQEHVVLARNAILAACRQIQLFREMKRGDDEQQARALAVPLPLHFNTASAAAIALTDRRVRATLEVDVERTSKEMDYVAQFLTMEPRLAWNRAYAAAFDAENNLRQRMGLSTRVRPYSGDVDPAAAIKQIAAAGKPGGSPIDWTTRPFTDPATATAGIAAATERVFDSQSLALRAIPRDVAEPPPASSPSIWSTLLDIAVRTAIGGAAGGIGSYAANAFRTRLEGAFVARAVDPSIMKLLPAVERDAWSAEILKEGVLGRAFAVEVAKDAVKEFFKSSVSEGLKNVSSKTVPNLNAREPLNAFVQLQDHVLAEARDRARMLMVHLAGSLRQADLGALTALHQVIRDQIVTAAEQIQYDHSMREWQNLKARLDAGAAPAHNHGAPPPDRDANIDEAKTIGAFEIVLQVDGDPAARSVAVRSIKLNGGEPAAIRHFRGRAVRLGELGVNRHYEIRIATYNHLERIKVGVGPDQGVLQASLDQRELDVLKVYAAGDKVTSATVYLAHRGKYAHVGDGDALRVVRAFIKATATATTASLED